MLHKNILNKSLQKSVTYMIKSKKAWFRQHTSDPYVKKAQQNNYRSRASFKLIQILDKNKNIKIDTVLDLGCAPGSWSQVVIQKNPNSKLVAVDLLEMKPIKNVQFHKIDARSQILHKYLKQNFNDFSCILSDMAPNFSGDNQQTHQQIIQLNRMCLYLFSQLGSTNGSLIMKTLQGQKQKAFYNLISCFFDRVDRFKPKSSRSHSQQFYYCCHKFNQYQPSHRKQLMQFIKNFPIDFLGNKTRKQISKQISQCLNKI